MNRAEICSHHFVSGDISMDLTSHKEHHIIKCLGLVHGEEKCGMSLADREDDLMLFIREHLPETAFSPFALDTALLPLKSAHGRRDTGRKRIPLLILPPPCFVHCPLNLNGIQALVYKKPCPITFFFLSLCYFPLSAILSTPFFCPRVALYL